MNRYGSIGMAVVALLAAAQAASAVSEVNYWEHVAYPSDVAAYSPEPGSVVGEYPAGWGEGAWVGNGDAKTTVYFTPEYLFGGRSVTIGEVKSISWLTNKDTPHNGAGAEAGDWYMQIYTQPFAGGDSSWYGHRINSEPYLTGANATTAPANQWNTWATDSATLPLRFFDANRPGVGYGAYTDPTWDQIAGGPIDWSTTYWGTQGATDVVDYSQEYVQYFSLATGSGWADGFTGGLDGLRIELTNGDFATVNFEPVPEPVTMATLFGGLAALGGYVRRRTRG